MKLNKSPSENSDILSNQACYNKKLTQNRMKISSTRTHYKK